MPLHVSSTCAYHQEVKIVLYSLWDHHTYRWPSGAQVERGLSQPVHRTATYRCDDTRYCLIQFWPDDEHMCSKHVEAWNKLIVKQKCCASIWLITEIKVLYMFRVSQHPSSGVLETVTAASLQVIISVQLLPSNVAKSGRIMTCTGGCGYSF